MSGEEPELEGPKGFRSSFHVDRNGVNQVIGAAAYITIQFNRTVHDVLGEYRGAPTYDVHPRRLGRYYIKASAMFTGYTAGTYLGLAFVSGGTLLAESNLYVVPSPAVIGPTLHCSLIFDPQLVTNIYVQAFSGAGAASAVHGSTSNTYYLMQRLQ